MSPVYACDQTALLKILLHSAKYPAASVNGVLLGRISKDKQSVEIVDAIPLLHSFLTLAPALETALVQVRLRLLEISWQKSSGCEGILDLAGVLVR